MTILLVPTTEAISGGLLLFAVVVGAVLGVGYVSLFGPLTGTLNYSLRWTGIALIVALSAGLAGLVYLSNEFYSAFVWSSLSYLWVITALTIGIAYNWFRTS